MSGDTAGRVVEAARAILVEEGSNAASMRRVAERVGITAMAIYRHFPNREALLSAVADREFARLGAEWREHAWNGDPDAGFRQALDQHLDFALGEPHLYAFLFTEPRAGARIYPTDFRAGGSPTLTILAVGLRAGMDGGRLRQGDEWELALQIAAQIHGLVQLRQGGRIGLDDDEFRALCARSLGRILDAPRV